jgi:SAM-dependent methyltransferase
MKAGVGVAAPLGDRARRILEGVDVDRLVGLEIGALDKPLVSRAPGRQIFYADYAPREVLREKSAGDPNVDIEAIPEVDYIIVPLPEDLGRKFDYIVASHVGEHVPDLIGWLKRLANWLTADGQIILALPDRRFTFDLLREHSTVGQLIEAHLQRRHRPTVASVYDGFSKAVRVDAKSLWDGVLPAASFPHMFSREVSLKLAEEVHAGDTYRDCHCWVFTAPGFRSLLEEIRGLGLFDFEWVRFVEPTAYMIEFYVSLRPR